MPNALHQHDERSNHPAHALDATARFNDVTADKWIEDACQQYAADWIVEACEGQTVLDLGYGAGIVTGALLDAGKSVTVVEGSAVVLVRIPISSRCTPVAGMFESFIAGDRYDTIVASHVLEHIEDPVAVLKRLRKLSKRLVVLVPNAQSWHRKLAKQMGLIKSLHELSPRDIIEGHVRVYDKPTLDIDLSLAGWEAKKWRGFFLKTLPNAMMLGHSPELIRAMNEIYVRPCEAANIGVICE